MNTKLGKLIFGAILSVCIIVPFSNDIFISGFPAMSEYFVGANVSLVLSVFFLGLAIAQPIYGPLSDRFGRKPVLLVGLWIYTIASALVMLTNSFPVLIIGRFFQALGVCSASISVYAIVRDVYDQEKIIGATSAITAVIGAGPAMAPLLGSLLNTFWGWRASFIYLFILGIFFTLIIQIFFKETLVHKNTDKLSIKSIAKNYLNLAKLPKFSNYCITRGFSYGVFFSYFSLSSLFLMTQMGFNIIGYGVIIAINGLVMIVMVRVAPLLSKKIALQKIIQLGLLLITIGGLIMWGVNEALSINIYTFMLPMLVVTAGIGLMLPTASAGAIQLPDKRVAGSAAAFVNAVSFIFGSIATAVTPKLIYHVGEFGLFIFGIGIIAFVFMWLPALISCNFRGPQDQKISEGEDI